MEAVTLPRTVQIKLGQADCFKPYLVFPGLTEPQIQTQMATMEIEVLIMIQGHPASLDRLQLEGDLAHHIHHEETTVDTFQEIGRTNSIKLDGDLGTFATGVHFFASTR